MKVIRDNAPAHRGETLREYLGTPGLGLQLVNLPVYSPDFNADEAISGWAWEEATGNQCLGRAAVQETGPVPGWADRPESRGETVLSDSPAIQGGNITAKLPH